MTRVFKNFNAGSYSFGIDLRLRTVRTLVLQFLYYRMNIDGVSIGTGNLNCHEFILKKKSRSKTRVSLKAFKDDLPENVANLYIRI